MKLGLLIIACALSSAAVAVDLKGEKKPWPPGKKKKPSSGASRLPGGVGTPSVDDLEDAAEEASDAAADADMGEVTDAVSEAMETMTNATEREDLVNDVRDMVNETMGIESPGEGLDELRDMVNETMGESDLEVDAPTAADVVNEVTIMANETLGVETPGEAMDELQDMVNETMGIETPGEAMDELRDMVNETMSIETPGDVMDEIKDVLEDEEEETETGRREANCQVCARMCRGGTKGNCLYFPKVAEPAPTVNDTTSTNSSGHEVVHETNATDPAGHVGNGTVVVPEEGVATNSSGRLLEDAHHHHDAEGDEVECGREEDAAMCELAGGFFCDACIVMYDEDDETANSTRGKSDENRGRGQLTRQVRSSMRVRGVSLDEAEENRGVFERAIAEVAGVNESNVHVTFSVGASEGRKRRMLAEADLIVDYTIDLTEAKALTVEATMESATSTQLQAAINDAAAEDPEATIEPVTVASVEAVVVEEIVLQGGGDDDDAAADDAAPVDEPSSRKKKKSTNVRVVIFAIMIPVAIMSLAFTTYVSAYYCRTDKCSSVAPLNQVKGREAGVVPQDALEAGHNKDQIYQEESKSPKF